MTGGATEPATKDAAEGPRWDRHPGEPRAPFFLISNLNPIHLELQNKTARCLPEGRGVFKMVKPVLTRPWPRPHRPR